MPQKGKAARSRELCYRSLTNQHWLSQGSYHVKEKCCGKPIQPQVCLSVLGRDQARWRRGRRGHFSIRDKHSSVIIQQANFITKLIVITLARKDSTHPWFPHTTHTSHRSKALSLHPLKVSQHTPSMHRRVLAGPHIPSLRRMLSSQYSLFLIAPLKIRNLFLGHFIPKHHQMCCVEGFIERSLGSMV